VAILPIPPIGGAAAPSAAPAAPKAGGSGSGFGDLLSGELGKLDNLQQQASTAAQQLATGQATDVSSVAMEVERASLALRDRLPTPRIPPATRAAVDARSPSPYQTIATELRVAIHTGTLPPGTPLPTVQQLAATHHVAPSTAHRAITQLAEEHLITVTRGRRAIANSGSPER